MRNMQRFEFSPSSPASGSASLLPFLPVRLDFSGSAVDAPALLDTGATVNVMPYRMGLELGAHWQQQTTPVKLTGNLADLPAKALLVNVTVGNFALVRLAFAWTQAEQVPLILGQVNFFMEFNVCFFRTQGFFEIAPK
jgi:hypothetical protein